MGKLQQNQLDAFQFVNNVFWGKYLNLNFTVGIDGISVFFLILTTLLVPLCVLVGWALSFKPQKIILYLG